MDCRIVAEPSGCGHVYVEGVEMLNVTGVDIIIRAGESTKAVIYADNVDVCVEAREVEVIGTQ